MQPKESRIFDLAPPLTQKDYLARAGIAGVEGVSTIVEMSTFYFENPAVPFLIQRVLPGATVLILERDSPEDRLSSHYRYLLNLEPVSTRHAPYFLTAHRQIVDSLIPTAISPWPFLFGDAFRVCSFEKAVAFLDEQKIIEPPYDTTERVNTLQHSSERGFVHNLAAMVGSSWRKKAIRSFYSVRDALSWKEARQPGHEELLEKMAEYVRWVEDRVSD